MRARNAVIMREYSAICGRNVKMHWVQEIRLVLQYKCIKSNQLKLITTPLPTKAVTSKHTTIDIDVRGVGIASFNARVVLRGNDGRWRAGARG